MYHCYCNHHCFIALVEGVSEISETTLVSLYGTKLHDVTLRRAIIFKITAVKP